MIFWALFLTAATLSHVNGDGAARVVGGETVSIERYPSLVQVEFRNMHVLFWQQTCAANILNHQFLLSVAHCFEGFLVSISHRRIRAGSSFRENGGTIFELEKRISHPSYGKNDYDGDIAVIKTKAQMFFNNGIQPINIVRQGFVLFDNIPVTHAGWGRTRIGGGGSSSSLLRHIQVHSINHDLCVRRYKELRRSPDVSDNMICAGVLNVSDRDTCDGDEGGPLYLNHNILVGIVSWGHSCAHAYYPRVNTKIASYSDWILANIQ